jgi:HAMP domain-containing protein
MMGLADSFVMKDVHDITQFTIILAVIAIAAVAVIMYFVMNRTLKPISALTDILKNVGSGDLRHHAHVHPETS